MPGFIHQALKSLLEDHPHLVFELCAHFDAALLPELVCFEKGPCELPDPSSEDNVLYADHVVVAAVPRDPGGPKWRRTPKYLSAVAVEVHLHPQPAKYYAWLCYAAGVRKRYQCRGWTLVLIPDEDVRNWAKKMFENEPRASPWFVEPSMLPPIVDAEIAARDVAKSVLTAVFHARSSVGVACVIATLCALKAVDHPHRQRYGKLMSATLTAEQREQIPSDLIDFDPKTPLGPLEKTNWYFTSGEAVGRKEGRKQGRKEGRKQGLLQAIANILAYRGLALAPAQRAELRRRDTSELDEILRRALSVTDPTELLS
jgi:hypothetical protein